MLEITFTYDGKLDDMEHTLWGAVAAKVEQLTNLMRDKVVENVSGKILQKQSGQLADSIQVRFEYGETFVRGSVFPEPASPKAWALEKGGEEFYSIVPVKARLLSWVNKGGDKVFAKQVNHPPSKAFRYLGEAFDEVKAVALDELAAVVQATLDGT